MFDWLFDDRDRESLESARETYWLENADAGKAQYDAIRRADWADPDEWEYNLQREEGSEA
jgi:hypothetical protein